jgi:glyoxylase-like metal-dependent hydrolase (beta-lactamase superfamily II)
MSTSRPAIEGLFSRRSFLQGAGGLALTSALAACQTATTREAPVPKAALTTDKLTDRVSVITGAPGNVIVVSSGDSVMLVDSGSPALAGAVKKSLGSTKVRTLFNTHYHSDQTGGNALFGSSGAEIHAHVITRQWLSTDYYVPAADKWIKALPKSAWPAKTFRDKGETKVGAETIEYGYLLEAHTRGDIYIFFRDSNVVAVGDVASPLRDPALDWYSGGWLGGRVDALDDLLALVKDDTKIIPAYGAVMTRAQLQTERDMMAKLYDRTTKLTDQGRSAQDMLDEGVLNDLNRKFDDPYRFLYDVCKGHWAHYTNFGGNIV